MTYVWNLGTDSGQVNNVERTGKSQPEAVEFFKSIQIGLNLIWL